MNMSTSIDDLPGPHPEEIHIVSNETFEDPPDIKDRETYIENSDDSKVTANISKKIQSPGLFEKILKSIKKELNEENLLILCFIFVATLSSSNEQTRRFLAILPINNGFGYSHSTVTFVKCILLLIALILVKKFVL